MNRFVETNIIKWIRVICAHYPAACFVFVGTKADLIGHDAQKVRVIGNDLQRRLKRNEQTIVDAIDRELNALRHERQQNDGQTADPNDTTRARERTLESLRSQRPRFLSPQLLVVSSADLTGMQELRSRLEALIV
ncbi:hypothetical protein P43SY_011525 [Pythium insidiosum]|uniref:Uncharacterized protein n=1 Tax=Pythium insidiosum TaxID=114742 RepID=A0AAD5LZ11_PYTIN|nr:hypothetical protein P43SY_011525 [Pythium insidiosum]